MGTTAFRGARLLLPVALCLLAAAPVLADTQSLTLRQAVEIATKNNPEIVSFRKESGILDASIMRAGLLHNPTLEIEGETGALTGSRADSTLSLGVSQEFLLGDKRNKRRMVVERDAAAYRWQVLERERDLKEQVQGAYYDALLAGERQVLTNKSIELNKQLLQVAEDRLAAGDIPELEMYLVKVELARSEGARIDTERTFIEAGARLFSLLALPAGESPSLSGSLDDDRLQIGTLAELKRLALDHRPDLKAARAAAVKSDAEVTLAEAEAIPNLTAGIALAREASSMEISGVEGRETAYTVGLKFSMPIPLFDRNRAGVQEARARQSGAETRAKAAVASVEREVESAWASLVNAEKVVSLYKSSVLRQLEENLKLTQEAYRLGEVGILAVIEEQKKFFEVSESYLTALHARQMAITKLESAVAADMNGGAQ
ncbi:TolC family protein [Geomonas oryzae]|uniref:TolC family protein n=1 Tax=Geomonas oryzae TaxID=2364273 RepID=UPI00100A3E3B|nr:TolC family protein [Geomonas oryzae]